MKFHMHLNRDTWLEARKQGIGGSEAAAVLGVNPYVSPLSLYCRKQGLMPETEDNERMRWGRQLEQAIAEDYELETGRKLHDPGSFTIYTSTEYPWMIATIDRMIVEADDQDDHGVLQIKTARAGERDTWLEEIPLYVQVQVQHEMIVTGKKWGAVAVFFGDYEHLYIDVALHQRFAEILIEQTQKFWERIQNEDAPPPDFSKASEDALFSLYPQDKGETITLPGEVMSWNLELEEAEKQKKEAEAKIREIKNRVKNEMGEAAYGVLVDGSSYSWITTERQGYEVKPTSVRTLRRRKK